MPHIHNNILVVKYEELIPEFYTNVKSISAVLKRAAKKGYGMRKLQTGCFKNDALIEFDSLPPRIKDALGDPRKAGHILERYYKTAQETITFYQTYQFDDMTYIKDDIQERYITNASVLRAVAALKIEREREIITKGFLPKGIFNGLTADATSFNLILKQLYDVEHSLPESVKRFKKMFEKFQKIGFKALITKYHKNENAKVRTDETGSLLNSLFAGTKVKPSPTEVARQYDSFLAGYVTAIDTETGEVYEPKNYPKLSQGTITSYLAQWKNRIGNYAKRSGNRQELIQKFIPHHSLEKPKYAGEIISIDDRNPPFKYQGNKRVWFYLGIDLGSEAWTVWVHGTTKEGIIIDFYRQMIRNYHQWGINLPAELECERSLNSSYKNTFLQEGRMFQFVRIEANKARAKKIERYFGKLRYGNEHLREGWVARPFAGRESNQTGSAEVPTVPYKNIVENCLADLEEWNNTEHSDHPGKSRWDVFLQNQHPDLKPTNYRAILPSLGYKTETSCNAGFMKLDGKEFLLGDEGKIYFGEKLIRLMELAEGRKIDIYWLDANDGSIIKALVYIGAQFICEALPKPTYSRSRIGRTGNDDEQNEIMNKYSSTIEGFMRKQKGGIAKIMVIDQTPKTINNNFKITGKSLGFQQEFNIESDIEILESFENEKEAEYVSVRGKQFDRY